MKITAQEQYINDLESMVSFLVRCYVACENEYKNKHLETCSVGNPFKRDLTTEEQNEIFRFPQIQGTANIFSIKRIAAMGLSTNFSIPEIEKQLLKSRSMAQKFIIHNNTVRFGNVDLHKELATDHTKTTGGGYYNFDQENRVIYLYGSSEDFGKAQKQDIINALNQTPRINRGKNSERDFYYYDTNDLETAKQKGELIFTNKK